MKHPKSGFILLETLVCLAILGIIFPLAQKYVLSSFQNFLKARFQLHAAHRAVLEISRLETSLNLGGNAAEYQDAELYENTEFFIQSKIRMVKPKFYEVQVHIAWEYAGFAESYDLGQFFIPMQETGNNNDSDRDIQKS